MSSVDLGRWRKRNAAERAAVADVQYLRQDVTEYGYLEHVAPVRLARGLDPFPVADAEELRQRLAAESRPDRADEVRALVDGLPDHLGTTLLQPHPVRIALIADQFFATSLDGTAHLVAMTPDNWRDVCEETDLLLITSTWRGQSKEWFGLPRGWSARRLVIDEIAPHYRRHGKPVVFWSKEDPPHFERFLPLAKAADHVVTTAEEKLDDYRSACGDAASFQTLSFGVNPMHHNPVGSRRERLAECLFAGSWRRDAYPERRRDGVEILRGVKDAGWDLMIHDRHFAETKAKWTFPQEFWPHVAPALEHSLLLKLQRLTDVQINLNSVVSSRTMYANRVVELQAMGAFVLSNRNPGVAERFPDVAIIDAAPEVADALDTTDEERYRRQMAGLRTVFAHHTSHAHVGQLLAAIGLPAYDAEPTVVLTGSHTAAMRLREIEGSARPFVSTEDLRGTSAHVVVPLSDAVTYGEHHVTDLINGFRYTESDFITKAVGPASGQDHERVTVGDRDASALWVGSAAWERFTATGDVAGTGYAIDPFVAG